MRATAECTKPCYCFICGELVSFDDASVEHIVPVSLGGTDQQINLTISHAECNKQRGNNVYFRPKRGC